METETYAFWGKRPLLYKLSCLVTFLGREEYLRKRAIHNLELQQGNTVLDLACGTGLNFSYLQQKVGLQGKVIGFDYSTEMLKAAEKRIKENGWENVDLVQGDAAQLSLDEKIDGVLSTLGISAIPLHREALKRTLNILRSGGRITVLDAQPFQGTLGFLNSIIVPIYKYGADWDCIKNIREDLEQLVGEINVEEYNFGTIYIATGIKK